MELDKFQDNESDFSFKRVRKQPVSLIAVNNQIEEEKSPHKTYDSNKEDHNPSSDQSQSYTSP
jgi:hypothetical protein